MGTDSHDQYEAEAVAIEQWASREKCKVNIRLVPGVWRDVAYAEINALAESMTAALYAYFIEPAVDPYRVRLFKGARG